MATGKCVNGIPGVRVKGDPISGEGNELDLTGRVRKLVVRYVNGFMHEAGEFIRFDRETRTAFNKAFDLLFIRARDGIPNAIACGIRRLKRGKKFCAAIFSPGGRNRGEGKKGGCTEKKEAHS